MITRCKYCDGIAEGSILLRDGVPDLTDQENDKSHIDIINLCGAHYDEVKKLLTRFRIKAA